MIGFVSVVSHAKILIAEDDDLTLEFWPPYFEAESLLRVVTVTDGREALTGSAKAPLTSC